MGGLVGTAVPLFSGLSEGASRQPGALAVEISVTDSHQEPWDLERQRDAGCGEMLVLSGEAMVEG